MQVICINPVNIERVKDLPTGKMVSKNLAVVKFRNGTKTNCVIDIVGEKNQEKYAHYRNIGKKSLGAGTKITFLSMIMIK